MRYPKIPILHSIRLPLVASCDAHETFLATNLFVILKNCHVAKVFSSKALCCKPAAWTLSPRAFVSHSRIGWRSNLSDSSSQSRPCMRPLLHQPRSLSSRPALCSIISAVCFTSKLIYQHYTHTDTDTHRHRHRHTHTRQSHVSEHAMQERQQYVQNIVLHCVYCTCNM